MVKTWKRIEPTTIHQVGRRTVVVKTFIDEAGEKRDFATYGAEGMRHAGVVAITDKYEVIVVEQFRAGPERIMIEIPGGTASPKETVEAAARRELLEETGYRPGKFVSLGVVYKDAYTNDSWHYFLASDCKKVAQQTLDDGEIVNLKLLPVNDFIENALNGRMTDAEAVFRALPTLKRLLRKS